MAEYQNPTARVAREVMNERNNQDARCGEQNHPDHHPAVCPEVPAWAVYDLPSELEVKETCEEDREAGSLSWSVILLEEVVEALSAGTVEDRRAELIQVAAVAQAWIECIDRRQA